MGGQLKRLPVEPKGKTPAPSLRRRPVCGGIALRKSIHLIDIESIDNDVVVGRVRILLAGV